MNGRRDDSPHEPIEPHRALPARSLDLWFDYTCPFAYLGSTQAAAVAARMGAALTFQPMLLGGVFKAMGTPQNLAAARGPSRAAHEAADMARWARRFNVPLRMPADHPMRSVEALRATLATGVDPAVIAGFFEAYWVHGRAISSRDVIADVVASAGHDAGAALSRIEAPELKDDLKRRTARAIELGVFGAPTWIVDGEHLYWGQDRIVFVEGARRAARAQELEVGEGRTIDVYWDFSSPFAYLGASQVEALAKRTGARVAWHPILLGGLFRSIGTPDVPLATFSEAKRAYTLTDLGRWAAFWRVPFRFPSRFPSRSLRALRVYVALSDEHRARYRDATFRACWVDDQDIADDRVLAACIGDEALAEDALARADTDDVKAALRASTERAAARGVFGVPTFGVGGELFWGQDRLDLVEDALRAR